MVFLIGKRNESRHFGGRIGVQARQELRKSCRGGDSCVSLTAANLWWWSASWPGSATPATAATPPACNYDLPNNNIHPLTGADAASDEPLAADSAWVWE